MRCPQCGYLNRPADPICTQCGTWLPASEDGLRDGVDVEPFTPWADAPGADQSPPPSSSTFDPPPALAPNPTFGPVYDPATPPGSYGSNIPYGSQSSYGSYTDPRLSPTAPENSRAVMTRSPSVLDDGFGWPAVSSMSLGMGTLLKGGRYRLVQPYATATGSAPSESEPPLMIVNDTEVPNTRVLAQELPFGNLSPEDGEHARQILTQRLIALAHIQGLARLVDSFSERRRHFLIFELPTGDVLADRLRRAHGRLSESMAVNTALQALDVLDELERALPPVTHGNLCPAHIILRPSGQVALVGISPTLLLYPDGQALNGPAAGMPGYAAPEQARGQASPRADLFSVCALLYAALTGEAPVARATALYQPVRRVNPEVSLELEEVLSKGLRPSQAQRYQSAAELRAELRPIADGRRTRPAPEDLVTPDEAGRILVPLRDARGRLVLPRQSLLANPVVLVASVVALIALVGTAVLFAIQPRGGAPGVRPDAVVRAEAETLFMTKGIGLSGGEFVFDTDRPDNETKQAAERAAAAGDQREAMRVYEQASVLDPADAEAAIYAADMRTLISGRPYVTIVAAVAFGAANRGPDPQSADARAELQGVYLAQKRVNAAALLPQGVQLRVLILNSGKQVDDATATARLLLDEARVGAAEHLLGVVGWAESAQTRLALADLAPSGLAIVSPSASADGLGSASDSFFPLVAPDSAQASQLADAARQLNARRIVVAADPSDPVGAGMANAFTERVRAQYAGAMTVLRRDTLGAGSPVDLDAIASDAIGSHADLIYLAGGADDAITLASALRQQLGPDNNRIHILVGPQADTPALLGLGDAPTAELARRSPDALSLLYVATLAHPQEWEFLQAPISGALDFVASYIRQFSPVAGRGASHDPTAVTVLSYDSADLLIAAARQALESNKTLTADKALAALDATAIRTRLRGFDATHPFVGIGGAVGFNVTGTLSQKALAILRFDPHAPGLSGAVAQPVIILVVGGKALFCGSASCAPTV